MEAYAFPVIGDKRVDKVGSSDILEVLQPIWLKKPETARRVRQRMRAVFDWCLAKHFRGDHEPRRRRQEGAASPNGQAEAPRGRCLTSSFPTFLAALEASPSHIIVKTALGFLIHTASQHGRSDRRRLVRSR